QSAINPQTWSESPGFSARVVHLDGTGTCRIPALSDKALLLEYESAKNDHNDFVPIRRGCQRLVHADSRVEPTNGSPHRRLEGIVASRQNLRRGGTGFANSGCHE